MPITLHYTDEQGLLLCWEAPNGVQLPAVPIRVELAGKHTFYVWGTLDVDSGEDAPAWADPELQLSYFGAAQESPGLHCDIETIQGQGRLLGFRAIGSGPRAVVTLEFRDDGDAGWTVQLTIANPQGEGGLHLPLCLVTLRMDDLGVGGGASFYSAHPYGGGSHPCGALAELQQGNGVDFIHGCIGLALPLVYLHQPDGEWGIECEFMLEGRPTAWLRPGSSPAQAHWCVEWSLDRLLAPGQVHAFGGRQRFRGYHGHPVEQLRAWRDSADARYGIHVPEKPRWVREAIILGVVLQPDNPFFARFDAPQAHEWLRRWKAMGVNTLFAIACNPTGKNVLSPFDYSAPEAMGGEQAQQQFLRWVHEEGMHAGLWFTTVGLDREAREVHNHADWWTHRANQDLFYAWDSTPQTEFVGYAPDADALSTGWRAWLHAQACSLLARGWDGLFIDGCIPRASNHTRWDWPGGGRNSIPDQVLALSREVHALNAEANLFIEDNALYAQTAHGVTHSRYWPLPPRWKQGVKDPGMLGGPKQHAAPPSCIPPEAAREYQLLRAASQLPGVVSAEGMNAYFSEACRPWQVFAMLAGSCVSVDWQDDPGLWKPNANIPDPPEAERAREHRERGHAELLRLLHFITEEAELVRHAPMSIEGVCVEGDAAVIGLLRPSPERCLLALIQYADRPAHLRVSLREPIDIPAAQRAGAGQPDHASWSAVELLHSIADAEPADEGVISRQQTLEVSLAPYGFRVFALCITS